MATVYFITHPDVVIDPGIPVTEWSLSERGRCRMRTVLRQPWAASMGAIRCSTERKARDGAAILAQALDIGFTELATLGENDRSATGYLPRAEFEGLADAFFANPHQSVRGWERAIDAQRRIVEAIELVLATTPPAVNIAIVSHGAVGALLLCHLRKTPISRAADQPPNGGGNYISFDRQSRALHSGWRPIDAVESTAVPVPR